MRYTFYLLKSLNMQQMNADSAVPGLNRNAAHARKIKIPPLPEQKAIAHILGSLDDKIELNRRMNETLEAMAQTLFKSWFVGFDPVIDNALAAGNAIPDEFKEKAAIRQGLGDERKLLPDDIRLLFPSEFEHTEEMGWIPKGWKLKYLSEVFDFQEGPGIRNWQYTKDGTGIKFINIRCIQNGDLILDSANRITEEEARRKYAHFALKENDIVVSTSGTLGRYALIRNEHLPLNLNTSVIRFRPKTNVSTLYFLLGFVEAQLQYELEIRASGSVQKNFGPMHLKQIKLLIPTISLLQKHQKYLESIIKKRQLNLKESDFLSNLLGTLLPRLLLGRVRIQKNNEPVEKAK